MAKLRRGVLIAIEGIDGAGKTTQIDLLYDWLVSRGLDVVRSKEPTKGVHGQRLRESAATGRLDPEAELQMFLDDRREHVATLIQPALDAAKVVLVDRYYLSTVAYQGARRLDYQEILTVNESFAPKPDLLFILEITTADAMKRIAARGETGRNEFEQESELKKCAAIFAAIDRPYIVRIDGSGSREEMHHAITHAVESGPLQANIQS